MGRDKARLPYLGTSLVVHLAGIVERALAGQGTVTIIANPGPYRDLPYAVVEDLTPSCGPLGGVVTALTMTTSEWNLVVACDMPKLTPESLRIVLDRALESRAPCVAARGPDGTAEPLCAAYHRTSLGVFKRALRDKRLRMKDVVSEMQPELVAIPPDSLTNVNTPEDWMQLERQPG